MRGYEKDFQEKSRKHLFNCGLKEFPVVFEMYIRAFGMAMTPEDIDASMADIVAIIRTSENTTVAYTMVCHYLDDLEK